MGVSTGSGTGSVFVMVVVCLVSVAEADAEEALAAVRVVAEGEEGGRVDLTRDVAEEGEASLSAYPAEAGRCEGGAGPNAALAESRARCFASVFVICAFSLLAYGIIASS